MRASVSPPSGRAGQRGGTWLGFLLGLVVGLAVAAVVAVVITAAPVPFVERVKRPTEKINPGADGKLPDPNRPLFSAPPGGTPASPAEVAKAEAGAADPATAAAPGQPPTAGKGEARTDAKADAKGGTKGEPRSEAAGEDSARFVLQAGAFKTAEDADALRARLALLGLEAKIVPVEAGGGTLYRVRLGPYGERGEIERIRKQLTDNGIATQVIPQR